MSQLPPLLLRVLASSVSAASRAGQIAREVLSGGDLGIVDKGKNDLQTEADRAAQKCIVASLIKLYPGITIIGEEGSLEEQVMPEELVTELDTNVLSLSCPTEYANLKDKDVCVWVDPLDGTSEFTQGLLDHVTVLIGIAVGSEAVAGVIHQPFYNYQQAGKEELGRTIWGLKGAGVHGLPKTAPPKEGTIITTTRSHSTGLSDRVLEACNPSQVLRVGGAGHKVMLLMEGKAHAYVFASPGCKKWDTCAPEVLLRELGGELTDMYGTRYEYHPQVAHPNSRGVLATSLSSQHAPLRAALAPALANSL